MGLGKQNGRWGCLRHPEQKPTALATLTGPVDVSREVAAVMPARLRNSPAMDMPKNAAIGNHTYSHSLRNYLWAWD